MEDGNTGHPDTAMNGVQIMEADAAAKKGAATRTAGQIFRLFLKGLIDCMVGHHSCVAGNLVYNPVEMEFGLCLIIFCGHAPSMSWLT